jgi:Uncharacterized protein conserved in bacteria
MNRIYLVLAFFGLMLLSGCSQTTNVNVSNSAMNQNGMNHNMAMNGNPNSSAMDHSEMKSAPNASAQPYDLQFLDTMTVHHQGAIDMAKTVDSRTQNAELKKFAAQIISDQGKEITQMKDWREKWFAGKPSAVNMELSGMADAMKMDMSKLSSAKDKDFDLAFIDMMTPHHQGAISMSKEALQKAEHPEIKSLANQIIKAQESEIGMMQDWKSKWAK